MEAPTATILSANAAAERLPFSKQAALAWLRAEGLIKVVAERRLVIWEDVVQRIRDAGAPTQVRRRRRRGATPQMRRFSLD